MKDRDEARKERDCQFINRLSNAAHVADVRNNAEPKPFFPRKKDDDRSEASKAFQRKWLG